MQKQNTNQDMGEEIKNTKIYTSSLFLKSYIRSLCQQAKKIY